MLEGFKRIIEEGPIANGAEEGEWRGSVDEDTVSIYNYKNGIYQNGKSFNKAGQEYPANLFLEQPSFPGGEEAFRKFIETNILLQKKITYKVEYLLVSLLNGMVL